jgi:hypothetical protein
MRTRPHVSFDRREAFSLMEILSVLGAMSLVLLLGVTTLLGAIKMERTASASYHRQTLRSLLADQFREDVASAVAAPDEADDIKASSHCLILQRTDGTHVCYRWEAGRLERSESFRLGARRHSVSLGPGCATVEFVTTGEERRVLTLRLSEPIGSGTRQRWAEVSAALGGDLR